VPGGITVSRNGVIVDGTFTVSSAGRVVTFEPAAPWSPGDEIDAFARTLRDSYGRPFPDGYELTRFFLPAPPPYAYVVEFSPGRTGVARNVKPGVRFSAPLEPSSVSTSSVTLTLAGVAVGGTVSLGAGGTTV